MITVLPTPALALGDRQATYHTHHFTPLLFPSTQFFAILLPSVGLKGFMLNPFYVHNLAICFKIYARPLAFAWSKLPQFSGFGDGTRPLFESCGLLVLSFASHYENNIGTGSSMYS